MYSMFPEVPKYLSGNTPPMKGIMCTGILAKIWLQALLLHVPHITLLNQQVPGKNISMIFSFGNKIKYI